MKTSLSEPNCLASFPFHESSSAAVRSSLSVFLNKEDDSPSAFSYSSGRLGSDRKKKINST